MSKNDILICPVCKSELYRYEKSCFCRGTKKHCFDISSAGHVNLCVGKSTGGDDKKAVKSRTDFLNLGYYKPLADKLCAIIGAQNSDCSIVDAGCGEGYYSNIMAAETGAQVYGFDLSKEAVISAAKSAKRQGIANSRFFVGGIYDLPICSGGADFIVNIFAPCSETEFARLMHENSRLIIVGAGKNHLYGLKKAVYDEVYINEPRADMPKSMVLENHHSLTYNIELNDADAIKNLFSMTPYSYRTSERDMQKLLALTHLETEIDFDIFVYRKEK